MNKLQILYNIICFKFLFIQDSEKMMDDDEIEKFAIVMIDKLMQFINHKQETVYRFLLIILFVKKLS